MSITPTSPKKVGSVWEGLCLIQEASRQSLKLFSFVKNCIKEPTDIQNHGAASDLRGT